MHSYNFTQSSDNNAILLYGLKDPVKMKTDRKQEYT